MKKEGADLEEDLVDMLMRQLRSEEQEKGQKAPPIDPLKMYSDSQAFKGLFKTFDQKGIPKLGASDRTVPSATVRRLRQEQRNQAERFLTFQRSVLATLMSRDLTQIFKKNPKMKDKYSEFDSDGIPTKDQFGKKLSDKKRTTLINNRTEIAMKWAEETSALEKQITEVASLFDPKQMSKESAARSLRFFEGLPWLMVITLILAGELILSTNGLQSFGVEMDTRRAEDGGLGYGHKKS